MINEIFEKKQGSSKSDKEKQKLLENTKKSQEKRAERLKRSVSSEIDNVKNIVQDLRNILDKSKKFRKKLSKSEKDEEEDDLTRQYIPLKYQKKNGNSTSKPKLESEIKNMTEKLSSNTIASQDSNIEFLKKFKKDQDDYSKEFD